MFPALPHHCCRFHCPPRLVQHAQLEQSSGAGPCIPDSPSPLLLPPLPSSSRAARAAGAATRTTLTTMTSEPASGPETKKPKTKTSRQPVHRRPTGSGQRRVPRRALAAAPATCPKAWHGMACGRCLGRLLLDPAASALLCPCASILSSFPSCVLRLPLTLPNRPSNQSISPVQTNPSCIAPRAAPHAAFAALAAAHSNRLSAPTRAIVPV